MRPLNLAMFRTFVAGRSIDLEEARSLMSELPLTSWEVYRIPGNPGASHAPQTSTVIAGTDAGIGTDTHAEDSRRQREPEGHQSKKPAPSR